MKKLLTLTSSLALSALLLTAQAQVPAAIPSQAMPAPKAADKRAVARVAKDGKAIGQKMVQKSQPADGLNIRR